MVLTCMRNTNDDTGEKRKGQTACIRTNGEVVDFYDINGLVIKINIISSAVRSIPLQLLYMKYIIHF